MLITKGSVPKRILLKTTAVLAIGILTLSLFGCNGEMAELKQNQLELKKMVEKNGSDIIKGQSKLERNIRQNSVQIASNVNNLTENAKNVIQSQQKLQAELENTTQSLQAIASDIKTLSTDLDEITNQIAYLKQKQEKVIVNLITKYPLVNTKPWEKLTEQERHLDALKQLEAAIDWELREGNKDLQKNRVLVAVFLDTEGSKDSTVEAEYRCYHRGGHGGYSGIKRVPYRVPWLVWENVISSNDSKKIVIDPGPPYKNFTKTIFLKPGKVANLGRIVLEKAKVGVSISGTIKDENGKPLKGVEVSSKKGVVTTNAEGFYRIDEFGLEVCNLEATKKGYIPNNTKVSIRNMDKRVIKQDFVLSFPRKVRFRYVISPKEKDDFNDPDVTGGTVEFLIDKKYFPLPIDQIKNEDFRQFITRVRLNFRVNNNRLTLDNSYAPIFYQRLRLSSEKFETINSVGTLNYNSQRCPQIQKGDIILINGGQVSDYTLKILFEEMQRILP